MLRQALRAESLLMLLGELAQRISSSEELARELARITWRRALLVLSGHPSSSLLLVASL